MGTSSSAAQLAGKLAKAADAIKQSQKQAIKRGAVVMKAELEQARNAAVGSDGRLSHVGKSGAKLSVGYELQGDDQATVTAKGPWPLVENKVPAHVIRPKKGKKRGVAFGGVVRRSVHHPGVRNPKQPFKKGTAAGGPKAIREMGTPIAEAFRSSF
jgi:hypothetical protein